MPDGDDDNVWPDEARDLWVTEAEEERDQESLAGGG